MSPDELDRIEAELGIKLPEVYRRAVDPFPIPALAGNTQWMFWDDADALIALNKQLRKREGVRDPWPARFYALGQDDGGCSDGLDLDDPEHGVFWFDRQHIEAGPEDRSDEKLPAWITRQIEESTESLEDDGVDPSGTPEARRAIQEKISKDPGFLPFVLIAAAIALGLLVWILLMKR